MAPMAQFTLQEVPRPSSNAGVVDIGVFHERRQLIPDYRSCPSSLYSAYVGHFSLVMEGHQVDRFRLPRSRDTVVWDGLKVLQLMQTSWSPAKLISYCWNRYLRCSVL